MKKFIILLSFLLVLGALQASPEYKECSCSHTDGEYTHTYHWGTSNGNCAVPTAGIAHYTLTDQHGALILADYTHSQNASSVCQLAGGTVKG